MTVQREGGGGLDDSMKPAFYLGVLTMTLLLPPVLLWLRSRVALLQSRMEHTWQDALTRGIVDHLDDVDPAEALPDVQGVR